MLRTVGIAVCLVLACCTAAFAQHAPRVTTQVEIIERRRLNGVRIDVSDIDGAPADKIKTVRKCVRTRCRNENGLPANEITGRGDSNA